MRKVYLDLPQIAQAAVLENLQGYECTNLAAAEYIIMSDELPQKKIRIGEIVDKIIREFGFAFVVDGVKFELQNQQVKFAGKILKLTEKEVALIKFLYDFRQPKTRLAILEDVWNYSTEADTRAAESHIHRLNQKFDGAFAIKVIAYSAGLYELKISKSC